LKNKKYRDAFVASQISVNLPFQIRALREQRGWKQSILAAKSDMLQPRISAMESPGAAKFNLETLRRIASAFDVALVVRFVPFSELVDWSEQFNPDTFKIPDFEHDLNLEEPADLAGSTGKWLGTCTTSSEYTVRYDAVRVWVAPRETQQQVTKIPVQVQGDWSRATIERVQM